MSDAPRKSTKRHRTAEEREARRRDKQPDCSVTYEGIEWPRPKGLAFELPPHLLDKDPIKVHKSTECKLREFTTAWDEYDSFYYNGLMRMTFKPTILPDFEFLTHVKWYDQLVELSTNLGLGNMPFRTYPLYADLVLQFLSSCRVKFTSETHTPENGCLIFKLNGTPYSVTFDEIAGLYEFPAGERMTIPDQNLDYLWKEITGIPTYHSTTAKHSDIKHPVLRVFLKILANTLLSKMETGKMRKTELILLHYSIGFLFPYCDDDNADHDMHFGAIFACYLEELKERGLSGSEKTETVGSLLTPIFRKVGIDLDEHTADTSQSPMDAKYFKKGQSIIGDWGSYHYRYSDTQGIQRLIALPSPLCQISSARALAFRPSPDDFVHPPVGEPRVPRQRSAVAAGTSRARRRRPDSTLPPLPDSSLPPFPEPPVGSYEDSPFNTWMVSTWRTLWDHLRSARCCCAYPSDVVQRATTSRTRRQPTPPTPTDDMEEDDAEMAIDSSSTSGSPEF